MFRLGGQFLVLKECRFGRGRNRACSGKGSKWAIYRLESGSFIGVSGWAMDLGSGGVKTGPPGGHGKGHF